jgi:hypothetical protein
MYQNMEQATHKSRIFELADKLKKGEMSLDGLVNQLENGAIQLYKGDPQKHMHKHENGESFTASEVYSNEASAVLNVLYDDIIDLLDRLMPGTAQGRADRLAKIGDRYEETLGERDDELARKAGPEIAERLDEFDESFGETENIIRYFLGYRDILRDEVNRRGQSQEQKPKRRRAILPEKLPHYTFQEGRNPAIAIADPDGWKDVTGEVSLMYAKEDDPIQTKLTAGANLDWWDMPATYSNLRDELRTLGVSGVYCFYVTMGMVLQERDVTIYYDDLMKIMGWTARNAADREEKRRILYRWHTLFDNISVHGNRRGKYTDKLTGKTIDTTIQSKIFMISELEYPKQDGQQMRFDGSQAPVSTTLTGGPWLERFRGNDKILEYFGNIFKLSGLPTGQAHGEWALSIGMALNQLWRERAYNGAQVDRTGDTNQEVIIYKKPFTRFELLSIFPPMKFKVDEILKSANPKRAQEYWVDAVDLLKEKDKQTIETKKQISHYKELTGIPLPRQGWQDVWLHQHKFDIRPTGEARDDAVEICKAKTKRVAAAKRRSKTSKK